MKRIQVPPPGDGPPSILGWMSRSCLSYAVMTAQDGIWGGTTAEERRAMRGRPGRPAGERSASGAAVALMAVPAVMEGRAARRQPATPAGTAS